MAIRQFARFGFIGLLLLIPHLASAQAWLPPKGETYLSLSYQFLSANSDFVSTSFVFGVDQGTKSLPRGRSQAQVLVLDGDIGLTDRLAVNAAVAFMNGRYVESDPLGTLAAHGPADDGSWHNAFQDARIGARFEAVNDGSWVLTPAVSYGFPTTGYVTLGHAAFGRNLNELRLGLDWGRILSPKTYVQGNYSYAFMENVDDIDLDRSNLSVELGYILTDFVSILAWTDYQNVHGGLDWARDINPAAPNFQQLFLAHDRAAASDFVRVGGGVAVPVNGSVEVYAHVAKKVWGINTDNALTVSFGMSWGFEMFGGRDLGVWERDDANSDMDDWLLEALENEVNEEDAAPRKRGETSS